MPKIEKNYTLKIVLLFLATGAGIFAIWYALMREESVDWLSSQISHQASPYAITVTENDLIISNVISGYEFILPNKFKTLGSKNLVLFIEEAGKKKCAIRHYYLKSGEALENQAKVVLSAKYGKLVFESADKNQTNDCGKYLLEIKKNIEIN
ncbi:hypothetical protein HY797_01975 [Candidatus Falkowbacteria bacterium]|nr:hypothetical protein [Candidatus Falkowbacteria bacterium]